jgi:hypothetical protein
MVSKLGAHVDVGTGLVAVSIVGCSRVPPVTVLGLVADLGEGKLSLAIDLVVRNVAASVVFPLNKSGAVTRNPFCLELALASHESAGRAYRQRYRCTGRHCGCCRPKRRHPR